MAISSLNSQGFKMTRNEAIKKLEKVDEVHSLKYGNEFRPANVVITDKLIALGVLKVEEEKMLKSPSAVVQDEFNSFASQYMRLTDADRLINALMREGYEIVKKGNNNAE